MVRYDGTTWAEVIGSRTATTNYLYGVWGSAANAMWAVGNAGTLLYYNGSNATLNSQSGGGASPVTTNALRAIWGRGVSYDIHTVGYVGTLLHYNGGWSVATGSGALTTNPIYSVWGSLTSIAWAVGSGGVILKFNGSTWSLSPQSGMLPSMASPATLYGVWTANTNTSFAVGSSGTIFKYDGTLANNNWSVANSGTRSYLYGVWGLTPTDVWAVGDYTTILRYQP